MVIRDITAPPEGVTAPDGRFTTSDGAEMTYRIRGEGPPLILLHGWSQSGAMFQYQLEDFSDRFTVVVPDFRGHGESPTPSGGLRMARLAVDVSELMAHLRFDRVHMLGWSMGVSVIWAYIDQFGTSRLDRLVFVDQPSVLVSHTDMSEVDQIDGGCIFTPEVTENLCLAMRGPDAEISRAGFVDGMVTKTISEPLLDWIKAENAKTPPKVAAEMLASHCAQDWRDLLGRVDRPTLVTGGSVSHVAPASQRYIHSRVPGSIYHEFDASEGGAHFPFLEAPDPFNAVVGAFLDGRRD